MAEAFHFDGFGTVIHLEDALYTPERRGAIEFGLHFFGLNLWTPLQQDTVVEAIQTHPQINDVIENTGWRPGTTILDVYTKLPPLPENEKRRLVERHGQELFALITGCANPYTDIASTPTLNRVIPSVDGVSMAPVKHTRRRPR